MKRMVALMLSLLLLCACSAEVAEESLQAVSSAGESKTESAESSEAAESSAWEENSSADAVSGENSDDDGDEARDEVSDDSSSGESSDDGAGSEQPDDTVEELDGFRLSSIDDVTDENGVRSYTVYAPYTDT